MYVKCDKAVHDTHMDIKLLHYCDIVNMDLDSLFL